MAWEKWPLRSYCLPFLLRFNFPPRNLVTNPSSAPGLLLLPHPSIQVPTERTSLCGPLLLIQSPPLTTCYLPSHSVFFFFNPFNYLPPTISYSSLISTFPPSPVSLPLWEDIKTFLLDYLRTNPSASLALLGDFNSRLGPDNPSLVSHLNWIWDDSIPPSLLGPRLSLDPSADQFMFRIQSSHP